MNFKVGEKIIVKTLQDFKNDPEICSEINSESFSNGEFEIDVDYCFSLDMNKYCGKKYFIDKVLGEEIKLKGEDGIEKFHFNKWMVKKCYEAKKAEDTLNKWV